MIADQEFEVGTVFDMTVAGSDLTITNCTFHDNAEFRSGGPGMNLTGSVLRAGNPAPEGELGGGIPWEEMDVVKGAG